MTFWMNSTMKGNHQTTNDFYYEFYQILDFLFLALFF